MKTTLLTLVLAMTLTAQAGDKAPASSDRDEVVAIVNRFFAAISSRDVEGYRQVVVPGSQVTVAPVPERKAAMRRRVVEDDYKWLAESREPLLERPTSMTVHVEGRIAVVWAPYEFHRNGALTHTGVDVYTLLKTDDGWRISGLAYSVVPAAPAK
ncbi:MAG TPA: nuclear transport factor 2 family protein [Opitutaceae bacterium]|nr:nuclear transport factor 2 family protein [Opitutaceae bacterium]HND63166.1 nuclear transport factor 2 family protein [Opitutaceae bacterium]